MNITILTSSIDHPIYPKLEEWIENYSSAHNIQLQLSSEDAKGGDFLFLISCSEIIDEDIRSEYTHTLVVHASDLPAGRGWSPHIWGILSGANEVVVSLLEAEKEVDTGRIWLQDKMLLEGHELYNEINEKLFAITLNLMSTAIDKTQNITPTEQSQTGISYYPKRTPEDSALNVSLPLIDQFDLLRVADSKRFPTYFDHKGHRYIVKIKKDKSLDE